MFSNDLNSAYVYEVERRKDEMRAAAKYHQERKFITKRKPVVSRMAILSFVALLLSVLFIF